MQTHRFQYMSMDHHSLGDGVIRFCLRREEGILFEVELTVEDAQHLLSALQVQLPIAGGEAGREVSRAPSPAA
jgi:hypothetical protein